MHASWRMAASDARAEAIIEMGTAASSCAMTMRYAGVLPPTECTDFGNASCRLQIVDHGADRVPSRAQMGCARRPVDRSPPTATPHHVAPWRSEVRGPRISVPPMSWCRREGVPNQVSGFLHRRERTAPLCSRVSSGRLVHGPSTRLRRPGASPSRLAAAVATVAGNCRRTFTSPIPMRSLSLTMAAAWRGRKGLVRECAR